MSSSSLYILERLNKDAALRSSINQVATQVITDNKEPIEKCLKPANTQKEQNKCFDNINASVENLTMPLGWDTSNFPTSTMEQFTKQVHPLDPNNRWHWVLGIIKVIFGWLLSAAAIAMAAPFWFELLGKFINVRNAGQVPESTSKDKPS